MKCLYVGKKLISFVNIHFGLEFWHCQRSSSANIMKALGCGWVRGKKNQTAVKQAGLEVDVDIIVLTHRQNQSSLYVIVAVDAHVRILTILVDPPVNDGRQLWSVFTNLWYDFNCSTTVCMFRDIAYNTMISLWHMFCRSTKLIDSEICILSSVNVHRTLLR